jgi:16S rRNA processing protein RimM
VDADLPHIAEDDVVIMGKVAGAYGVSGLIRVHNYTEAPVALIDMPVWLLKTSDHWRPVKKMSARCHQHNSIVAKIEGVDDRDTAINLRHALVAVYKKDLPDAEENAFYWYELANMQVINRQNQTLGYVNSVIRSPANDILEVVNESGNTYLIPMVASAVDQIDRSKKQILVDWGIDWD